MISLNQHTETFEKVYFDRVWNSIAQKVIDNLDDFSRAFPEAMVGLNVNMNFFTDLLLLQPEEFRIRYKSVDYYFMLTKICHTDLQSRMKEKYPRSKYKDVRFAYFNAININSEIKKSTKYYLRKKHLRQEDVYKSNREWKKYIATIRRKYFKIYKSIKMIFDYNVDIDSEIKAELVKDLELCVCPYCNRQYINVFFEGNKNRTIADIDHFLPKDIYGLWADSLYNMIPSCKVCNMLFKGKRNIDMLNPFLRGYEEDAYFSLENLSQPTLNEIMGWSDDIKIRLKIENDDAKIRKMILDESRLFRIEDMYSIHSEYVKNLLYKKAMVEMSVADEMVSMINNQVGKYAITLDEVKKVLYGMDVDEIDFNKVPLGKLTNDILKRGMV